MTPPPSPELLRASDIPRWLCPLCGGGVANPIVNGRGKCFCSPVEQLLIDQLATRDPFALANELAAYLQPEASLSGTPMIPLHRGTIRRAVMTLDEAATKNAALLDELDRLRAAGIEECRTIAAKHAQRARDAVAECVNWSPAQAEWSRARDLGEDIADEIAALASPAEHPNTTPARVDGGEMK